MSVDTYLKGKNTSRYQQVHHDDVRVLLAPSLTGWAQQVTLGVKGALFWRSFDVGVEHAHGPT